MARAGMSNLILEARNKAQLGTADYVIGATTYWTDDQIQSELDKTQNRKYNVPLRYIEDSLKDYRFDAQYVERDSAFEVLDYAGSAIGTSLYNVNYDAKIVTFTQPTYGTAYYVNYRQYDLNLAVSAIWGEKASYYSDMVTWASDNHRVELSKCFENALNMAQKFNEMSSPIRFVQRIRIDEVSK
jgi:hypothetical protein